VSLLKAIFFDIDDTLYSTSEFAEVARERAIEAMIRMGLRMNSADLKAELNEVVTEFSSNYEYHFDKLLQRVPRRFIKGINPAVLITAAVVAYHDTKFQELKAYEDVLEVLRVLDNTDLVLGIITAGITVKQIEKLIRIEALEYISPNAIFVSDQIGISKPNVKLYQRACSDLNLKPGATEVRDTQFLGPARYSARRLPARSLTLDGSFGLLVLWSLGLLVLWSYLNVGLDMWIEKFEDIEAWQEAKKLAAQVHKLTEDGRLSKDFGLRGQIQRASVSIMANIAEGFGRQTDKEFSRFLYIARGSTYETQSHLHIALELGYISKQNFNEAYNKVASVIKLIGGFLKYLKKSNPKNAKNQIEKYDENR
jgi:putative hydrolase of the HAD superfamily